MIKSRLTYLLTLAASVGFVIFFGTKMAYMFLYALLLVTLLSFLLLLFAPLLIKLSQHCDATSIWKGEELWFYTEITNKSIFAYPRVKFIFFDGEQVIHSSEPAQGLGSVKHLLRFPYRGVYDVGVRQLIITDYLGLFTKQCKFNDKIQITVLPCIEALDPLPFKNELLNTAPSNFDFFQDPYADISHVNKYQPSDDIKKIHWKLSAKKNELVVKRFQVTALHKIMVFLDIESSGLSGAPKLELEDKIVCKAASVIDHCVNRYMPVELVCGEQPHEKLYMRGKEEALQAYYWLAKIDFVERFSMRNAIAAALQHENGFLNMVLLIHKMDFELFEAVQHIQSMGHHVIIFYFGPAILSSSEKEYFTGLENIGVHAYMQ